MMEQCQCEICQLFRRYIKQGVPEEVMYGYTQLVIADPSLSNSTGQERLDAIESRAAVWLRLYQAASEMIQKGLITEADAAMLYDENCPPATADAYYDRVKEYANRHVN